MHARLARPRRGSLGQAVAQVGPHGLTGLAADTAYYFRVYDSEGDGPTMWFNTAPDSPAEVTFVAGGPVRRFAADLYGDHGARLRRFETTARLSLPISGLHAK